MATCNNAGVCLSNCRDGWYEWNGCTDDPLYKAPNCSLYNSKECTEQASTMGVNVLGTQTIDVPARCPFDTDGNGIADQGGCKDVTSYSHGNNFMSIYELDPLGPDELLQTLYFPPMPVSLKCDLLSCPAAGSDWLAPSFYQSPSSPAKIYAEMATVVNYGTFVDSNKVCRYVTPATRNVNSASYAAGAIASESIATAFGESLAIIEAAAEATPLPNSLAGTTVRLTGSSGASYLAPLFFVSPHQVNYQTPAGLGVGEATVTIQSANGVVSTSSVRIERVAPGIFTANANGQGVPAAYAVRVRGDGSQTVEAILRCGSEPGSCVPAPIDLGPETDRVFLILYGTGVRGAGEVTVRIGNIACEVRYAGPQGQYVGLDQINVLLPRTLHGISTATVSLAADGRLANVVTIVVQ
jgi:uncharacterized protein (TIGR03437 family)